jgi:hypothetical protein
MKTKLFGWLLLSSALAFWLAACAPAAAETQGPGAVDIEEDAGERPAATEAQATTGEIVIDIADACALFTQEQVEAAFGKAVVEVNSQSEVIGVECEYVFDAETDTQLRVTFYNGDAAKQYFAALVAASDESCDSFFEAFFDLAFGQGADSGQDLESTTLADLYRQYLVALEPCMYAQSEDRPQVGTNVVASEVIFLNWSSNVAVLGGNRVVELTYQEPVTAEAEAEFDTAMDRDSFYALAQPYRDTVLAGYTEILVGLLQEVK